MKALDIGITKRGSLVLITQVDKQTDPESASVEFIGKHKQGSHHAWHDEDDLEIIDSLPLLLARAATSRGNSGFKIPDDYFGERS